MTRPEPTAAAAAFRAAYPGCEHRTGAPLVRIYGPVTTDGRGGTVAFNVLARDGSVVDYRLVEAEANRRRISLRTGCFCHPGAREAALGFTEAELAPLFRREHLTVDEQRELLPGRPIGAVRVSLGIVTTPDDVARLVELLRGFADRPAGRWPARLRRSLRHGSARAGRSAGLARPQ